MIKWRKHSDSLKSFKSFQELFMNFKFQVRRHSSCISLLRNLLSNRWFSSFFSSQKNLGYFIPYFCLDTLFLYISVGAAVAGILIRHQTTFRNCLIFSFKFYPSSCIYSLYKKFGGQPISISKYESITHHIQTPHSNPAIRLARSDTEFEESSRKSSNECLKPKVSFQTEHEASSFSEPKLSPQNHDASILKPCFRKSLQLPINNSYP